MPLMMITCLVSEKNEVRSASVMFGLFAKSRFLGALTL
jgi:hypothetical protein